MRAEVLRGHIDLLLLATLEDVPVHGYGIIQEVRRRSGGAVDLAEGTAYLALHRLEAAGLLQSRWEVRRRRRRVYGITPAGRKRLAHLRREWSEFALAIQQFVETT